MTTIAIVGAGPGLGAATARRFASEGFEVALVSRSRDRVDALAAQLADAGVPARGYVADVRDAEALASALRAAALAFPSSNRSRAPVKNAKRSRAPKPITAAR